MPALHILLCSRMYYLHKKVLIVIYFIQVFHFLSAHGNSRHAKPDDLQRGPCQPQPLCAF